ncbi:MAG TPA: hypothetical protein VHY91_23545 [Pirellulales bacterium]|nr:hypothetical protein [Pirellulales bacterium]
MLDELSQQFADTLLAKYPQWRPYLAPDSGDGLALEITIPSPNPRLTAGLYIETDVEITVGVDWFHLHCSGENPAAVQQALDFIDGFLNEELVVLAYFKGERWTGSRCVRAQDPWPAPEPGQRRLALSWTGSRDAEMFG